MGVLPLLLLLLLLQLLLMLLLLQLLVESPLPDNYKIYIYILYLVWYRVSVGFSVIVMNLEDSQDVLHHVPDLPDLLPQLPDLQGVPSPILGRVLRQAVDLARQFVHLQSNVSSIIQVSCEGLQAHLLNFRYIRT